MISNFLSKENVTLLLSILGIAGSASSWLYTIIKSRKRFEVRINGYRANAHGVLLHVQLINKSTLALSIGNISICSGKEYPANPLPAKVLSRTHRVGDEVKSRRRKLSTAFQQRDLDSSYQSRPGSEKDTSTRESSELTYLISVMFISFI